MSMALVSEAVRRLGRSPALGPWLVGAYRAACRGGALYLIGLEPTRAIYVSGSMARDTNVVPGVSDIDLVSVAELATTEAELAFREALAARQRRLNAVVPAFHSLEYFDLADVAYLRAFGNGWVELDTAWRRVAGTAPPGLTDYRRPGHELRLARLVQALLTWRKSGCHLLDPRLGAADWVLTRAAERVLAVTLAMWLDHDRHEPLAHLLDAGARRGLAVPVPDRGPVRGRIRACLAASLTVLEHLADECTAGWSEAPSVAAAELHAPSPGAEARARSLVAAGFASAHLVPCETVERGHRLLALAAESDAPAAVVERAERAFLELPPATPADRFPSRPLVLTPRLWRAALVIDPSPWLGAALASGAARSFGAQAAPIVAPPPAELDTLLRLRSVELFYRARGRRFRIGKPFAPGRLAADLNLASLLARAMDTGEIALISRTVPRTEPAQIGALRDFVASRRAALRDELERRVSARVAS